MNGTILESAAALTELFQCLSHREPFIFELRSENGVTLTVGFAVDRGFVQYSSSDGLPPYLVARADARRDGDDIEYLAGGTLTPIAGKFCLRIEQVEEIATHFLASGDRSGTVIWEEI